MDWPLAILAMFGILVVFMATGMPIAFAFMITCVIGSVLFWGGMAGVDQLAMSVYSAVASWVLLPVPLFILMGNVIFESGVGMKMVDATDKLLGRLPGRLSILAIGAGTLLGTMMGISGGSIAILGRSLVPEMTKRGYHKSMSVGPIVASGTLAVLIPPSALAVILGAIGRVSVGRLLISIIMPGLLLAALFCIYIIVRCMLKPSLAPSYDVGRVSVMEKVSVTLRYIVPLAIVIFAAIGVVFVGIATPSEAAALGAVACFILAAIYKKLNISVVKTSAIGAVEIMVLVLMIVVGSISFSRVLASSGAITGLVHLATSLTVPPIVIIILIQVIVMFLGCFMDPPSIVMVAAPMFMPVVQALGFDTLWFATIMLINIQLGCITPPFGLDCYTMKALAPPDVSLGDVFRYSMPFCGIGYLVMALIMIFPALALWLPNLMSR